MFIIYMCMHTHVCMHMHVCMCVHMHVCMCMHMHVCMCMSIYTFFRPFALSSFRPPFRPFVRPFVRPSVLPSFRPSVLPWVVCVYIYTYIYTVEGVGFFRCRAPPLEPMRDRNGTPLKGRNGKMQGLKEGVEERNETKRNGSERNDGRKG